MNVFYLSYGNVTYSGRTLETIKVMKKIGDLFGLVRGNEQIENFNGLFVQDKTKRYKDFIKKSFALSKKNKIDILFIDNRKATIPAIIIKFFFNPKYIIYDMWELYLIKDRKSVTSKLGCIPERYIIRKSDIVICANKERADIVKKNFKADKTLIFENIRKLEYSLNANISEYQMKYREFFNKRSFKIISTSGTSVLRGNDKLVLSALNITCPIDIFLVGGDMEKGGSEIIENIIKKNKMENIHIIGKINHDELKYLISQCDCGVVNYHSNDVNNEYCASGKIYEFIFEGKPVITTSNPPLNFLVKKYDIGCSSEDYAESTNNVIANYSKYAENVKKLKEELSVEENNKKLQEEIISTLGLEIN